jgi:hypothetical protein
MTDSSVTSNKYNEISEIFRLVDNLPPEKQTELLCQYGAPYLPSLLFHLILNMPDSEKQYLLDEIQNPTSDKRAYERQECIIATDYVINDRVHRNFVKDISEGGVFIETNAPTDAEVGDKMVQSFSLRNEQILFKFTGEIVRLDKKGIGVKFSDLTPYQLDMIRTILKKIK